VEFSVDAGFEGTLGARMPGSSNALAYRNFTDSTSRPLYFVSDGGTFEVFVSAVVGSTGGAYTLTAAASAFGDYFCETGFVGTPVTFDLVISDANSCAGTIEFGPFVGQPLQYHYWYARLEAGRTYRVQATNLTDATVALFVINADFVTDENLALDDGTNAPSRTITFVPSADGYYYFEVSKSPGADASYSFQFREGG
jgi:hypothetical protein